MDDNGPFQRMLSSLRQTFNQRLPAGLTEIADARLKRTLNHYIGQVQKAKGDVDEQEVLRESYDSMASWFRRNTEQIGLPRASEPPPAHEPQPSPQGIAELPTIAIPPQVQPVQPVQAKDVLQKQEDVVKYRDTEYNLIVSSRDRDWLNAPASQNRYNFSVQFDSTRPQRTGAMPTLMQRLRNIVRIEFVKAILPVESLRTVIPRACTSPAQPCTPTATNSFFSVLALPSVMVQLDEHQGNNVGTTNATDRSLAVCQYDATWRSDHGVSNGSRGYTLFIPKFMKAQRIYAPAPLANFQRLSFQLTDPDEHLLSTCPDSNKIAYILGGCDVSGSCYSDAMGDYIFLQTTEYFPVWAYSQLDLITLDGLAYASTTATLDAAGKELIAWLQRSEGHVVVGTAYGTYSGGAGEPVVYDGANACGYANFIVIRNRFTNPASGACSLDYFTGAAGTEPAFLTSVRQYPAAQQSGGVLNLSRQVQLTLRVITRDYDGASNLRPDNV